MPRIRFTTAYDGDEIIARKHLFHEAHESLKG